MCDKRDWTQCVCGHAMWYDGVAYPPSCPHFRQCAINWSANLMGGYQNEMKVFGSPQINYIVNISLHTSTNEIYISRWVRTGKALADRESLSTLISFIILYEKIHMHRSVLIYDFFLNSFGQVKPEMYTEMLPGGQTLALLIPSLTQFMAGMYYCSASYASTEHMETAVRIDTYGKFFYTTLVVVRHIMQIINDDKLIDGVRRRIQCIRGASLAVVVAAEKNSAPSGLSVQSIYAPHL